MNDLRCISWVARASGSHRITYGGMGDCNSSVFCRMSFLVLVVSEAGGHLGWRTASHEAFVF
jgi:hypothetical protein